MGHVIKRGKRQERGSLRSQAVGFLRDAILSRQFKPGAVLNEKELAERLGVSKTPIREGLSLLEHEGLVQTISRRGYIVTPITVQHIHELFDLRIILESAAAERAAFRITDDQVDELNTLVPDATPAGDMAKWLGRNVEFHYAVACISGNERLAGLIKRMLEEMQRMIAAGYVPGEHEKVLRALREREPRRAAEAMREHIEEVRRQALRVAEQS
jgi:GntR family transcriptional regulator, rspAB operon transcriptional repressor